MSSVGNPTALKTISIVTRAALGILATPILVAVDVKLKKIKFFFNLKLISHRTI